MTLALDLARLVNCTGDEPPCGECNQCDRIGRGIHADLQIVKLQKNPVDGRSRVNIGIDQVRDVQREVSLKPYEGRSRVVIFDGAEALSDDAANALLKTLEEPPDQVLLILVSSDTANLLTTIVSRCQTIELKPLQADVVTRILVDRHGVDLARAQEIAEMSGGRPGWAIRAVTDPELLNERAQRLASIVKAIGSPLEDRFDYASRLASEFTRNREQGRQVLDLWLEWWRETLLRAIASSDGSLAINGGQVSRDQATAAIKAVLEARYNLERNVNPRLAVEEMMLRMPFVALDTVESAP